MKTPIKIPMCFLALRKSHYALLLFALLTTMYALPLTAQVAIGDSVKTAHPSAELEVFSESKGFLPPRITTAQRDSIANPADGLIVYDMDLNKLMYYHNDAWKDFGLWSMRDSTSGNIYYNGGRIAIGPGSDTSSANAILNITGSSGIASYITPDAAQPAVNAFEAELNHPGDFNGNFLISATQTNNPEGGTVGLFSYLESDARTSLGIGTQSFYTGEGGDLDNMEAIPLVIGSMTDAFVLDTLSVIEVIAIGANNMAESSHKGINIGNFSSAVSPATYSNIGMLAITGDTTGNTIVTIRNSFPARFTAATALENFNNTANDFNLYAHGETKSYFGGNVGIGVLEPEERLHVAGNILADDTIRADNIKLTSNPCNGCVLTSDATGLGSWVAPDSLETVSYSLWVNAGAMIPQKTNGAKATIEQSATNLLMTDYFLFDTSSCVQFSFASGKKLLNTVSVKIYWDIKSGASAGDTIKWGVSARAVGNDDAINGSWGSETTVSSVVLASGDMHITAPAEVTIGNTPATGDMVWFRIRRLGGGTYVPEHAKLAAVSITY